MTAKRKIARQSLPDVIASDLRERILSGELPEGTVIRQEALADEYDVSRMPIREALKRLDSEGLVHLTNNRGASVVKHSIAEIAEIFDLRILIEIDLFKRAIPNMTQADFDQCEDILNKMETSYDAGDAAQWGALNFDYHTALYAAAGRGLTNELLHRVNLQSDRYVRMHLSLAGHLESAKEEHRRLLAFAKARDVDAAAALLTHHISNTKDELVTMIAELREAETR